MSTSAIPPLPAGYKLDGRSGTENSAIPPVPVGYKLDRSLGASHPPLPPGYTLDQPPQRQQNNAPKPQIPKWFEYGVKALNLVPGIGPAAAGFIENSLSGEEDRNKFGAGRSFATGLGLPTSAQEVLELQQQQEANRPRTLGQFGKQLGKAALKGALGPGGQIIQGAYQGLKETVPEGKREIDDAARNIAEGGPIFPNLLKANLGSLTAQSGLLAPLGGRTLMRAGEQFESGASGIPGTRNPVSGSEIVNPFTGNWQGGLGSTGAVVAPLFIGEGVNRLTAPTPIGGTATGPLTGAMPPRGFSGPGLIDQVKAPPTVGEAPIVAPGSAAVETKPLMPEQEAVRTSPEWVRNPETGKMEIASETTPESESKAADEAPTGQKSRPLQSGDSKTMKAATAKALNERFGKNLTGREWGRALEDLKGYFNLPSDFHGQIMDNGDFTDAEGNVIGNIHEHL